jgi:hypothetical protein
MGALVVEGAGAVGTALGIAGEGFAAGAAAVGSGAVGAGAGGTCF